jgi:NAD(P)H-nitrite reductase large subunit
MEQNISGEILDKLTKVCLCKGIPRSTMKKVIKNGARTVEEVRKATGAGSGPCSGRRCTPKIEELLRQAAEEIIDSNAPF